jgi:hypothetical protein
VPVPPPGVPGPFSLADPGRLAGALTEGGFADVVVEEIAVPLRPGSLDEWWTKTTALAGPVSKLLAALPADALDTIAGRAREAAAAYATPDGIELPGLTLLARARRA